ncbi:MAG TPA: saccharopine dehydrogenase C-terminal domain-containing protein [Candidatus Mcinerneyibacterium sp.]|nr:saccharopine dehydrogenase C-terminal domain-containing protein [Candidatus Mcinerneyibacterium sp.]
MNILILGAGRIGSLIANYLSDKFDLTIIDSSEKNLEKVEKYGKIEKNILQNERDIYNVVKNFKLVVGALPANFGNKTVKSCIQASSNLVDISFMKENSLKYNKKAKENEVTIIPDAGFAPGLSNLFVGRIFQYYDKLEECGIRVGGLPLKKVPPLYYKITWSPKDLIEEYTRKARIINNNNIIKLDPLENINKVNIKNYEFEDFFSDGLRTLLETIDVPNLWETTLRWKGHLKKIKTLRELNFFSDENINKTLKIISPLMNFKSRDFSIMEIISKGIKNDRIKELKYFLYDEEKNNFKSMSRVTGFTAAVITELMANRNFDSGIYPLEIIGFNKNLHDIIINKLRKQGIRIEITF